MNDKFSLGINSAPMWLRVTAIAALIASLAVNVYFGVGTFHTHVADTYITYVMPPRWTFRVIWIVIYLLYTGVLLYVALKDRWPSSAYWASIAVSVLSAVWVGVFTRGTTGTNLASLFIVAGIFAALYTLWTIIYDPAQQSEIYFLVRNVVSLYMGWILVATVLNLGIVLIHNVGFPHKHFTILFWIATPLLFILITWLAHSREKGHGIRSLIGFWAAGLWGMLGALISTYDHRLIF